MADDKKVYVLVTTKQRTSHATLEYLGTYGTEERAMGAADEWHEHDYRSDHPLRWRDWPYMHAKAAESSPAAMRGTVYLILEERIG